MAVHHSSDQLMLALAAQCMQTSLISFDKILISYDTEDGTCLMIERNGETMANYDKKYTDDTVSLKHLPDPKKSAPEKNTFFIFPMLYLMRYGVSTKIRKLYLESYTVKQLCTRLGWFRFPKILKFTRDKAFSNNN